MQGGSSRVPGAALQVGKAADAQSRSMSESFLSQTFGLAGRPQLVGEGLLLSRRPGHPSSPPGVGRLDHDLYVRFWYGRAVQTRFLAPAYALVAALALVGCSQTTSADNSSASQTASVAPSPSASAASALPSLDVALTENLGAGWRLESSENPGVSVAPEQANRFWAPYNSSQVVSGSSGQTFCGLLETTDGTFAYTPVSNTPTDGFTGLFSQGC